MSAKFMSLRAAHIARIRDIDDRSERRDAWQAYHALPYDHFDVLGSQAADREHKRTGKRPEHSPPVRQKRGRAKVDPASGVRCTGTNAEKRAIVAAARSLGWKGKSYRKAKLFGRKMDRAGAAS